LEPIEEVVTCPDGVTKRKSMKLKRYLMLLGMLVAVGSFFAGLTIARAGDDDICGDQGDDDLAGNAGNDVVVGGPGNDKINVRHHGLDKVRCGSGHDVVKASRNDKVASNCEVVKY
jgi:Ca2+-binding RTX toxin-like protein